MKKLLIGVAAALLLASCAYTPPPSPQVSASQSSGIGHPGRDYPGPRLY
jgi:hypothetical protein